MNSGHEDELSSRGLNFVFGGSWRILSLAACASSHTRILFPVSDIRTRLASWQPTQVSPRRRGSHLARGAISTTGRISRLTRNRCMVFLSQKRLLRHEPVRRVTLVLYLLFHRTQPSVPASV